MFDLTAVSKCVQRPWVNPEPDGLARSEHAAVFGEHAARFGEPFVGDWRWIDLTDIVRYLRGFYPLQSYVSAAKNPPPVWMYS